MVGGSSNRYADVINKVGQYVYDHRDSAITLDELSSFTGFSKYHFNRVFAAATGYQLGEFIQRRKLEFALHNIQSGNKNITDVALSVGYDSPSSFTRAFSKQFGVTPSEVVSKKSFLRNERGGQLPPKVATDQPLTPEIVVLPNQVVLGMTGRGFSGQAFSEVAGELYTKLVAMVGERSFEVLEPVGVTLDNPWVGDQTEARFFAGFLNGLTSHASELESFLWEAGTWARFTHKGPHNTMWQTVSKIYAQWVIPNDISLKDVQVIQKYLNRPQDTPGEELETEIYFALDVDG